MPLAALKKKKQPKYLRIDLTKLHMNENETVITSM